MGSQKHHTKGLMILTVQFFPTCIYVSFVTKVRNFLTEGRTPVGSVKSRLVLPGSVQVRPRLCSGCRCLAGCSAVVPCSFRLRFCSGSLGSVQVLFALIRSGYVQVLPGPCSGSVQVLLDPDTTAGSQHRTRPKAGPGMRKIPSFVGGENRRAQG